MGRTVENPQKKKKKPEGGLFKLSFERQLGACKYQRLLKVLWGLGGRGRADVCAMTSHIAQGATKILFHEICLRMQQQQQQQSKVCLSLKVYFSPEINQIALV